MRYVTSAAATLLVGAFAAAALGQPLREVTLRERAMAAGLVPVESLNPSVSDPIAEAGGLLFASEELSLTRQIACESCHLDRFASADGIPIAIGVGGVGEGIDRVRSQGDVLPRNTLPLWGRGALGFDVLFWDGRVDASGDVLISQFGLLAPSADPLVVAVHLPLVQVGEMVADDEVFAHLITETVESAALVYDEIVHRVRSIDELASPIAEAFGIDRNAISIEEITQSIAEFIRSEFRLQSTRLHEFVFGEGELTASEIAGGITFYGKGRCSSCHNGPFFSDLDFHAIPFGQLGFGANGFGVDYGRFNVTFDPLDLYKFRTPPLFNVALTSPYSHSGYVFELAEAIRAHVDPLSVVNVDQMNANERVEFYRRLEAWVAEPAFSVALSDEEIDDLVAFLSALTFVELE